VDKLRHLRTELKRRWHFVVCLIGQRAAQLLFNLLRLREL